MRHVRRGSASVYLICRNAVILFRLSSTWQRESKNEKRPEDVGPGLFLHLVDQSYCCWDGAESVAEGGVDGGSVLSSGPQNRPFPSSKALQT
jgi:hypothetical protein